MNKKVIWIIAITVVVVAVAVFCFLCIGSEDLIEAGTYVSEDGVTLTVEKSGDNYVLKCDDSTYAGTLKYKKFSPDYLFYQSKEKKFDDYSFVDTDVAVTVYLMDGEKSIYVWDDEADKQFFLEK